MPATKGTTVTLAPNSEVEVPVAVAVTTSPPLTVTVGDRICVNVPDGGTTKLPRKIRPSPKPEGSAMLLGSVLVRTRNNSTVVPGEAEPLTIKPTPLTIAALVIEGVPAVVTPAAPTSMPRPPLSKMELRLMTSLLAPVATTTPALPLPEMALPWLAPVPPTVQLLEPL